ncbi:unnamed protein product [Acanthosepion pharaonis]|uniref:Uncharacterized protein n=1 Tax=Acanthosepion pharaonis TaxID=158019 RepID=A0A812CIY7_ACAPH|nr:unnamed protein product [Sepia pharaonis]
MSTRSGHHSKEQPAEYSSNSSKRLLTHCLNTTAGPVTLVSMYASTLSATSDTKDEFYDKLATSISSILRKEQLVILVYKRSPSKRNLQILQATNEYWTELSKTIQTTAITGNIRGMYDEIKTAMGPVQNKTAPLKSTTGEVIVDKGQQMERWVEHYSEPYSRQNVVTTTALDVIECLLVIEDLDTKPTTEKLSKAIDSLASGKVPGSDGIPPDLIGHCKIVLLLPLHEILYQCWIEGAVPQDEIITLYKNKGERSDCNNYRGILLLSIVGKVFARVILVPLCRNSTQSHSVISKLKDQQ